MIEIRSSAKFDRIRSNLIFGRNFVEFIILKIGIKDKKINKIEKNTNFYL